MAPCKGSLRYKKGEESRKPTDEELKAMIFYNVHISHYHSWRRKCYHDFAVGLIGLSV